MRHLYTPVRVGLLLFIALGQSVNEFELNGFLEIAENLEEPSSVSFRLI